MRFIALYLIASSFLFTAYAHAGEKGLPEDVDRMFDMHMAHKYASCALEYTFNFMMEDNIDAENKKLKIRDTNQIRSIVMEYCNLFDKSFSDNKIYLDIKDQIEVSVDEIIVLLIDRFDYYKNNYGS